MSGAVWVTDPGGINLELFPMWLDGIPVERAAVARRDAEGFSPVVVLQDTIDEYRTFQLLQGYMENPLQLATQTIIPLTPPEQHELVAVYYAYDDAVMREILCKQLSGRRLRNDLDEVADKTKVSLKSCQRQYDNLRRIFKKVEDRPGRLSDMILQRFLLKPKLAHNYARLLFMWNNKLLIDKPNLGHLELAQFLLCSQEFMARWTSWSMAAARGARSTAVSALGDDQDMDRKFLRDLRELKPLVGAKDVMDELGRHCIKALLQRKLESPSPQPGSRRPSVVAVEAAAAASTPADRDGGDGDIFTHVALAARTEAGERIKTIFSSVVPSLFQIGAGLSHSRELRDIFEDVVDNVVIPCQKAACSREDVKLLFSALQVAYSQLTTLPPETRVAYAPVVRRFLAGLSAVTAVLYIE
mmetsp:Transcript_21900/g.57166  ORF Transcript_21900/g.57166 Transcript_21900/m.57166 type:complete len:414 (-) Transcript_21900:66-1307(-)